MTDQRELAARFLAAHHAPQPLLLPNPWDAGSARILASLGFDALATTSSGHAETLGRLDGAVTRTEAIEHAAGIAAAVAIPVSADLENGFADEPDGVVATIEAALGAGLDPPSYFGTEVVARYVGLRDTHPPADAAIDLFPTDPITRAEAAHSFAVVLRDGGWAIAGARAALRSFQLPRYDAAQREVLRIAVSKIGMPYVWGGTTDNTADGLAHGGYDCSGFIWRVYKVSGLPWGRQIGGRTAAKQAGEIPKSARIRMRAVAPGDLLFFGTAHFHSTATEANIVHEGLALGDGWVIHSSDQGVYVSPLKSGWLHDQFAWARRVLS